MHADEPPVFSREYPISLAHRRKILERLPVGGRLFEYGCNDTTLWLRANCQTGETLLGVENDARWADLIGVPCTGGPAGREETRRQEEPTKACWEYVKYPERCIKGGRKFDVIIVAGAWRTLCLLASVEYLARGGALFLYNAERDWYQVGRDAYETVCVHADENDPSGAELWEGRIPDG